MGNLAQRRAAKALRRKAIVRAKRKAEMSGESEVVEWAGGSLAPMRPTHKASAALLDVAELLAGDADDLCTWRKNLMLTMFAWNLSLLPLDERKEKMRGFFDDLVQAVDQGYRNSPSFDRDDLYSSFDETVAALINRKAVLYPFDRRWLMDLEVLDTPSGFHVNVLSALDAAA